MRVAAALSIIFLATCRAWGGPPFVTDDPNPTDVHHFEIDFFSTYIHSAGGDTGQMPGVEIDYGIIPDVSLQLIPSSAYARASGGSSQYGYGDTVVGGTYRFLHETEVLPEAALVPVITLQTGDAHRGLGNGYTQIFFPIWFQKSFGKWTDYGGGGFGYNPGHRNFVQLGDVLEYEIYNHLTLGGEIYNETESDAGQRGHLAFNLGGSFNFDEHNHILFSAGRDILGDNRFATYVAYQLTF
jgi:hypothetical protein